MKNKLNIFTLFIIAIIVPLFVINFQKGEIKKDIANMHSEVFRILLDSALTKNKLPNSSYLKNQFPFGDTIIFKYNKILENNLPKKLKYKILTEDELCQATAINWNMKKGFRYFLEIEFVKKNEMFNAIIECHCIYYNEENKLCEKEKYCNGVMSMKFQIKENQLHVSHALFSSY